MGGFGAGQAAGAGAAGGFSMGASDKAAIAGRRIVKAKRPTARRR